MRFSLDLAVTTHFYQYVPQILYSNLLLSSQENLEILNFLKRQNTKATQIRISLHKEETQSTLSFKTFKRLPTYPAWTIVDIWPTTHPPNLVHGLCEWPLVIYGWPQIFKNPAHLRKNNYSNYKNAICGYPWWEDSSMMAWTLEVELSILVLPI